MSNPPAFHCDELDQAGEALEAALDEHLGYDKHDPAGRNGGNSRNGRRPRRC